MTNVHEVRTVRCAQCGRLCHKSRHWFVTSVEHGRFRCAPLLRRTQLSGVATFNAGLKNNEEPACGQQCAQKIFERYLAAAATESPSDSSARVSPGTE
jgi:hypothetical protein